MTLDIFIKKTGKGGMPAIDTKLNKIKELEEKESL